MSGSSPPPPMTHSAAYYGHQRRSNSSSPAYHYPLPALQRPPVAYVSNSRDSPAETYRGSNPHVKTSVSSVTSASSAMSDFKPYQSTQPYRSASLAERGLVEDAHSRRSQIAPQRSHGNVRSNHGGSEMVEDNSAVIRYVQQQQQQQQEIEPDAPEEKDHAIWLLLWLSILDPFHSLFSAIFSICTLFILILLSPLRVVQKQCSFSTSLIRTIAPIFRNHLQMIYAPSVDTAHTFDFSPTALILVHMASPLLSIAIAFMSWIAAVFWLFALIMGNPDGTEKRDDGRATVLLIRNWWEKYLLSAIRK